MRHNPTLKVSSNVLFVLERVSFYTILLFSPSFNAEITKTCDDKQRG
jgi:hypothetical protein